MDGQILAQEIMEAMASRDVPRIIYDQLLGTNNGHWDRARGGDVGGVVGGSFLMMFSLPDK